MSTEHVDVLIIGAGLSGIGAAVQLQRECPTKSVAILEARHAIGGTWDLFRYPGIRSDSDMFTLGFGFKPWTGAKSIADGADIRQYVVDTAREHGITDKIRFGHRVLRADWSSVHAMWEVEAESDAGETVTITCSFLYGCAGYYRYDEGYTPDFPGIDTFAGQVVHPQHWPEDIELAGKRVVVIGSGATAVTLVPSLAPLVGHVTMLQRSPTYVISQPGKDPLANLLRKRLPAKTAYSIIRWKNVLLANLFFQLSRKLPKVVKAALRKQTRASLPADFDMKHFTPTYNPWDQRVCVVPDGDLFKALRGGTASIVTDHIDTFTPTGIKLQSGQELDADIVVTATGLNVLLMGGIEFTIDGDKQDISEKVAYKGMMLSGIPNFAFAMGYTNASWSLKCDLVSSYVCRLVNHLDETNTTTVTPQGPGPDAVLEPLLDLSSGYLTRVIDTLPKQGPKAPWRLAQNYPLDLRMMRYGKVQDEAIVFSR